MKNAIELSLLQMREVEELSASAWPSLHDQLLDGWLVRFGGGYSGRSNSVYPLYPGWMDLDQKIQLCEQLYQQQGLSVRFKLTPASQPAGLDARLEHIGYILQSSTSIQLLDLSTWRADYSPAVILSTKIEVEWLNAYLVLEEVASERQAIATQMLQRVAYPYVFASIRDKESIIACGLGVLTRGAMGLFGIVVHPAYRRRGYGYQIVASLLSWGHDHGAYMAYLQVTVDNLPAIGLYAQMGFREIYQYCYRIKEIT